MADLLHDNAIPVMAEKNKKRTLMPLLVVVFLASYGLMTLLIVEQGETIQSQRNLIQVLLGDSRELWAAKAKAKAGQSARDLSSQASPGPTSSETPSSETPSNQVLSKQTPSNQVEQHSPNRAGKAAAKAENRKSTGKQAQTPRTQVPPMPAAELGDQRRVLITL